MNTKEKYQKSKDAGYSDDEIVGFLLEKDPSFKEKYEKSKSAGYTTEDIISYFNQPKQQEKEGSAKGIAKQYSQGLGVGAISTYGDILELFGLQAKEQLPGEKEKHSREFKVLEKMERGEVPSYGEMMELSDEEYPWSRLPTSKEAEHLGKEFGLLSEPKNMAERYAKRIGRTQGAMISTGLTSPSVPIVSGIVGQTIEEAGGSPWMQAAGEILATLKLTPKTAKNLTSKSPEVEKTIQDLRKAGYSERDITLAKSALEERRFLKKYASLTPEAENAIQSGIKNSETLLKEQIKKGLPGYAEGGLPYLEKQASNVYQTMEDVASSVHISNSLPVKAAIEKSIAYLEKYPLLKEQKDFIEFLKDGLGKLSKADTAEFYTGFYRNLNKAGSWGNPKQKEHILKTVKDGIKETFEHSGKEGKKFGEYFEKTNDAWKKWIDTKEIMGIFEKSKTVDGVNFKKLTSSLNDPDNYSLAVKVLGPEQVKNINSINKGASAIESLIKKIPRSDKSMQSLRVLEGMRSLFSGNFKPLAAVITMEGAKRVATDMLINPDKQNLMLKIISAAKNNSPQAAYLLSQQLLKEEESKKYSSQPIREKSRLLKSAR